MMVSGGFMVYGYIRVSTDRQTVENQRFEIAEFCRKNQLAVERWIEETISGTKVPEKRRLGALLDDVKPGDLIICSELSRLGRSLFMIMSVLSRCMAMGAKIWTIKDNYRLGDDIQSKVLAFAFGLSAEIERNLISQRTKEALARCKAEGKKLGRPFGKVVRLKLAGREEEIRLLLTQGFSRTEIGRRLGVDRNTVRFFIMRHLPDWSGDVPARIKTITF
jgi:DNA invertase Pin-like site-specific DNA recombinase